MNERVYTDQDVKSLRNWATAQARNAEIRARFAGIAAVDGEDDAVALPDVASAAVIASSISTRLEEESCGSEGASKRAGWGIGPTVDFSPPIRDEIFFGPIRDELAFVLR